MTDLKQDDQTGNLANNTPVSFSLRASSPIWASEASREGLAKGELAAISFKFSFVLRPDEGNHWLKNDVPEIKVD